jgi:hypothetical protein
MIKVRGDFNDLLGGFLCLPHSGTAIDVSGAAVQLHEGMDVIAFEEDQREGTSRYLVAQGRVVRSPNCLPHQGSQWCIEINSAGVRYLPTLDDA